MKYIECIKKFAAPLIVTVICIVIIIVAIMYPVENTPENYWKMVVGSLILGPVLLLGGLIRRKKK